MDKENLGRGKQAELDLDNGVKMAGACEMQKTVNIKLFKMAEFLFFVHTLAMKNGSAENTKRNSSMK